VIESRNPANGELLETFVAATPDEIERTLARAAAAFDGWRRRRFAERASVLREAARRLRAEKAEHARTMALEMGKPVTQGEEEIEKCAWSCDFFAEHGEAFMAELPRETEAARSYVRFDPLGPSSPSCRGTSPSGRSSASPRPRSWRVTSAS
jgi:succinate-semialdehyde dehydrogenase/glutarate-semialdehyde dehydrogenase